MQDIFVHNGESRPESPAKVVTFFLEGEKEVAGRLVVKSSAVASKKRRRRRGEAMSRGIRFPPPSKRTHSSKMETAILFLPVIRICKYLRYGRELFWQPPSEEELKVLYRKHVRWLIFLPIKIESYSTITLFLPRLHAMTGTRGFFCRSDRGLNTNSVSILSHMCH